MKKILIAVFITISNILIVQNANAIPTYTGRCQDVGFNDKGENTLVSCSSGLLSATPECTIINKGVGVITVLCGDSKYRYTCGNGSYNGTWYKIQPDSYKCVN